MMNSLSIQRAFPIKQHFFPLNPQYRASGKKEREERELRSFRFNQIPKTVFLIRLTEIKMKPKANLTEKCFPQTEHNNTQKTH